MNAVWYAILALMFAVFAATEGRHFGTGAVSLFVAGTREERSQVVRAIGPLWSWHETWLVAAGGVLFLAFPKALATALSGYYLAVFLLLWCLLLRGLALEVGGHVDDPLWRSFWDALLWLASVLLAVLFGAALGNVLRGVPLDASGRTFLPLFTDFGVRGELGILDWYTLSVALFTLVALAAHGATHLAAATEGRVAERSAGLAERLWPAVLVLLGLVTWQTGLVRAGFFHALFAHPAGWLAALAALAGLGAVVFGLIVGMEDLARTGSTLFIGGLVAGAAAGSYPELLHATTDPARSLTAFNAGTDARGLEAGLWWFIPALGLSLGYAWLMARRYPKRLGAADD